MHQANDQLSIMNTLLIFSDGCSPYNLISSTDARIHIRLICVTNICDHCWGRYISIMRLSEKAENDKDNNKKVDTFTLIMYAHCGFIISVVSSMPIRCLHPCLHHSIASRFCSRSSSRSYCDNHYNIYVTPLQYDIAMMR